MQEQQFMSLYDFLGKAAGGALGKDVFEESKKLNIKTQTKDVSNSAYSGKVMMYPVEFLNVYFKKPFEV